MTLTSAINLQFTLRLRLLDMYYKAKAGHIGCSLSCIDLLIASLLQIKKGTDSFILSKGHAAAALYACLEEMGSIGKVEMESFYKNGTRLPAHPAPLSFPEIPLATGSLGHGFPFAAGLAKAKKLKGENGHVMVILSDGETNEGSTWEAAHFAVSHRLDNLIVMVDCNGLQGFGNTANILGNSALPQKFSSIGMQTEETDGHDVGQIMSLLSRMKEEKNEKPKLIVAHTIKGKGVTFMENKMEWHYLTMNDEQYQKAKEDVTRNYSEAV